MSGDSGDDDGGESENEREIIKNNSDEEMCSPLHRPKVENKMMTTTSTSIKRSDERTVSESTSSPITTPRPPLIAKTGKSLSRSYSSPNIADHHGEDDDSQNVSSQCY